MEVIFVCKECNEPGVIDKEKSNENMKAYKTNCEKCGGQVVPKVL